MRLPCLLLLGACVAATAVSSARACSDPPAPQSASIAPVRAARASLLVAWRPRAWVPPATAAQGLRVSIDPVDGTYAMPAADDLSSALVVPEDMRVNVVRRANGSGFAALDDRFADFAVVAIGKDGKPHWTCVHGSKGAERFMQAPVIPTAPVGEEK